MSSKEKNDIESILKESENLTEDIGINSINEIKDILTDKNLENFQEQLNETTSKKTNQKKNQKLNIKTFSNSIEFFHYMEDQYLENKIKNDKEIFPLKNYNLKKKIEIITPLPKMTLSSLIFKSGIIITSLTSKKNKIYVGTNKGEIRVYSCNEEKKLYFLTNEEIQTQDKRAVSCMDVSDNNNYLISGYLNGYIALWNVQNSKCIKLIKDEMDYSIIVIKFTMIKNDYYEFLASDIKGTVKRMSIEDGFFFSNVYSNPIVEYKSSIFLIEILKFNEKEKKLINKYINNEDDIPIIAGFGSIDNVFIAEIQPENVKLYNFSKPIYINSPTLIPDFSFGIGNIPINQQFINLNDFTDEELIKYKPNKKATELNLNIFENYRLFSISWGKVINIVVLIFDFKNHIYKISLIGHYINKEPIVKIGFLSESIIYILGFHKKFKILNTTLMTPDEVKITKEEKIPISQKNSYHSPELGELDLNQDILFQVYVPYSNKKNSVLQTYNNFITNENRVIYIPCNKNFYLGCLLNWEQCINELYKNKDWMDALKLGLDIYHGKNKSLPDIPINEKIRQEKTKNLLKGILFKYITNVINNTSSSIFYSKNECEEIISKAINICIDFCLDINEKDYLFNTIVPLLDGKGHMDIFMEKISPFILCGKISDEVLGQNTISLILNYYVKKKDYKTYSKLIVHINIKSLNIDEVKEICKENGILTPLIYIYMNSEKEDCFILITKIYEIFKNSQNISFEKYCNYQKSLSFDNNNEDILLDEKEIEKSKQYLGHKLLWYIDICLNGYKYPNKNNKISIESYENLVINIFSWLAKIENLTELINFDSLSFFYLLTKFFTDTKIFNIIKKTDENKSENSINEIFNKIKNIITNNKENIYFQDDYNLFILKSNSTKPILDKKIIIESTLYLLNFQKNNSLRENQTDNFGYHWKSSEKDKKIIQKISNEIIKTLSNYENKLDKKDLENILNAAAQNNNFTICIYILKLRKEYIRCLEIYINEKQIENRIPNTFKLINDLLKNNKEENRKKYKEEILKKVDDLAELSPDNLIKMTFDWFNDNHLTILNKLKKPEIKLLYIETLLKNNNNEDIISEILPIHIEVLCKLNKKEQILPIFQENGSYINDKCLKICLENEVLDAAVFIYMNQDNSIEALQLCLKSIRKNFNEIIALNRNNKDINSINKLVKMHQKIISECFVICETDADNENLWFKVISILYQAKDIVEKIKENKENLIEFEKILSNEIENLIIKMSQHINISTILEKIIEVNKKAEIKELKKVLLLMEKESNQMCHILKTYIKSMSYYTTSKLNEINILCQKGNFYRLQKCDFCNKNINEDDKILLFKCGHNLHINCSINDKGEYVCNKCLYDDLKKTVNVISMEKKIVKSDKNKNVIEKKNSNKDFNSNRNKKLDELEKKIGLKNTAIEINDRQIFYYRLNRDSVKVMKNINNGDN